MVVNRPVYLLKKKKISGSRNKQREFATKIGATIFSTITQKLDVLVLGSIASRD
jgi:hypothetical protein